MLQPSELKVPETGETRAVFGCRFESGPCVLAQCVCARAERLYLGVLVTRSSVAKQLSC